MSRYIDVTIGGKTIKKHWRDVDKDSVVQSLLPEAPSRVFESSAGKAVLARELRDKGYDVTISNFILEGMDDIDEHQVDLNKSIPLADELFDAVICKEVIEHVESVPHTLREFSRILRPGGSLVLTFPNRLNIRSRFYHFLTGFYKGMKSPINLDVPLGEGHINLIGYPEMDYFLRHCGFTVDKVTTSQIQFSDRLFLALRPFIRLMTNYFLLHHKKTAQEHDKTRPENRDYNKLIARTLLSTPIFLGKCVILKATKDE